MPVVTFKYHFRFLIFIFLCSCLVSIAKAWLNKRPEQEAEVLKGLFDKSFDEILRHVQENCVFKMDILEHNYIVQVSELFINTKSCSRTVRT